ncbi:MAG: 4'-phosphopantetheinyl transferase superfamily protein [Chitinophagaceae bacterium]|nr:4'-phosphopantetheinyl transferase superfamily protein [Chitinophagaceae bacterium]
MVGKKLIHILYTRIPADLPEDVYKKSLIFLPEPLRDKYFRYRQWKDRAANLFSKILLINGLQKFGFDYSALEHLQYNQWGRPYLTGHVDFNIAHSGDFILCALGDNIKLGIDIEQIKPVDFSDFENLMTSVQWNIIKSSGNPLQTFFRFWAIKESIIKADGRGLSVPLNEIVINEKKGFYETSWHLQELDLDQHYCASLACNVENPLLSIEFIDIAAF